MEHFSLFWLTTWLKFVIQDINQVLPDLDVDVECDVLLLLGLGALQVISVTVHLYKREAKFAYLRCLLCKIYISISL